jgi:hypothetical protein
LLDRHQDRVSVGLGLGDIFGTDIAGGARLVLDDELLTEPLRQMLPGKSRHNVRRAAGGERDDQANRPGRISLGPRGARRDW